jgi:uncharacterized small protein (DUF1192 family)
MLTSKQEDFILQNLSTWSVHELRDCIEELLKEIHLLQDEVNSHSESVAKKLSGWTPHPTKGWVKK